MKSMLELCNLAKLTQHRDEGSYGETVNSVLIRLHSKTKG